MFRLSAYGLPHKRFLGIGVPGEKDNAQAVFSGLIKINMVRKYILRADFSPIDILDHFQKRVWRRTFFDR